MADGIVTQAEEAKLRDRLAPDPGAADQEAAAPLANFPPPLTPKPSSPRWA